MLLGNGDGTFQSVVSYSSGRAICRVRGGSGCEQRWQGRHRDRKSYCLDPNVCAGGAVGVLLGNGDGTFQAALNYDGGRIVGKVRRGGGFEGDGKPDLVVTNRGSPATVGVLLGNGDGTFQRWRRPMGRWQLSLLGRSSGCERGRQ